jgi:hypothetical protein
MFIASLSLPALNASLLHCFNFLPYLTFHCFIASRICLHCLNALTNKILTLRSHEAMNSKGNFQKICYFRNFRSKAEKHCRLCLYICLGTFCSVYLAISVWIIKCWQRWSDEAMKRGDEALNASSLQFLNSVKRFIASSLRFFLSV